MWVNYYADINIKVKRKMFLKNVFQNMSHYGNAFPFFLSNTNAFSLCKISSLSEDFALPK